MGIFDAERAAARAKLQQQPAEAGGDASVYAQERAAARAKLQPTKLIVAEPQPENPSIQAAKGKQEQREITGVRSATRGALQDARLDALSQAVFDKDPELLPRSMKVLEDVGRRDEMKSGAAPYQEMPAVEGRGGKEHLDLPAFLSRYGVAGLRPAGAAMGAFADSLAGELRKEHPEWTDAQLREAMWKDSTFQTAVKRPSVAGAAAKAALGTLKTGKGGVFDEAVPSFIDAPGKVIAKYGEDRPREVGTASDTVANFGRALMDVPGYLMQKVAFGNAVRNYITEGGPKPQAPVMTIPPESPEEATGRTAPGLLGMRWTPEKANTAALGLTMAAPVDLTPLAAKGLGAAKRGVGTVAKAVAESPQFLPATTAVRVAASKAGTAARLNPVVDTIGSFAKGNEWDAMQALVQARAAGVKVPGDLKAAARDLQAAFEAVPAKQAQEVRRVGKLAEGMKVDRARAREFSDALELQQADPAKAAASLQALAPAEQQALLTYLREGNRQTGQLQNVVGKVKIRDDYMFHGLDEATAAKVPAKVRDSARGDQMGGLGIRFQRARSLPEKLTAESGAPVRSLAEVEDYFQKGLANPGTSKIVDRLAKDWNLKPGEPVWMLDPRQNFVSRFIPGAMQNVRAEAISKLRPLAPRMKGGSVLPHFTGTPEASVVRKATGKQLPKAAMRMVERLEKAPAKFSEKPVQYLASMPVNAWKSAVTTFAGPGYHLRNKLYSLQKRLGGEFSPGEIAAMEGAFREVKGGSKGAFAGVDLDAIRQAARDAGTWEGTGAGPMGDIRVTRRAAGLAPNPRAGLLERDVLLKQPKLSSAIEKAKQLPGQIAQATDEGERMRAILGQLGRNQKLGSQQARLADAIEFGNRFIVRTDNKSPAMELASKVWPFIAWNAREAPEASKAFAAGKLPIAARVNEWAKSVVPTDRQEPEAFQQRRQREGLATPTGGVSETGNARYMITPGAPNQVISSLMDPAYRGVQALMGNESPGDVGLSVLRTAANNALPPIGFSLAELSGKRPLTGADLSSYGKASAQEVVFAEAYPDLAEEAGIIRGADGEWYSQGHTSMLAGMMPWSYLARTKAAPTPQKAEQALLSGLGLTFIDVDPTIVPTQRRLEITKDREALQRKLIGPGGVPARLVYKRR